MKEFGQPSHKLARSDHPDTSKQSAKKVQSSQFEQLAYEIIKAAGQMGCIADDVQQKWNAPERTQYFSRISGLIDKGLILDTGARRKGISGRLQSVYVAKEILEPVWLEYILKNVPQRKPAQNDS